MAPKPTNPKKKQNGVKKASPATAEMDSLAGGATDYGQQQSDEIEVLKSIYMDDYEEIETKAAWGNKRSDRSFRLKLRSLAHTDIDISIVLSVQFTATYPKSLPALSLQDAVGLREKTVSQMRSLLHDRSRVLLGEVMIFELASNLQDIVEDEAQHKLQGQAMPSLEEQRVAQQVALERAASQQQQEAAQRTLQAQAEEERVLQQMVEDEMHRRQETKRKSRPVSTIDILPSTGLDVVQLDRSVRCESRGHNIEFSAVTAPIVLGTGPLTQVSMVQPVLPSRQANTNCVLVIKQVSFSLSSANDKKKVLAMEDELESLCKVNHPNLAQVLDFRVDFGDKWSVTVLMEYARKGSLAEEIATFGALPVARVRIWFIDLLEALDHLHRHGIVHKRIHVSNVLLVQQIGRAETQVRLADAGFQDDLHEICGTRAWNPEWMAPEGNNKTRKTDIWDLGTVFLQMLFGLNVTQKYTTPSSLVDSMPLAKPLEDIIWQLFKSDPKKRPTAFDLIPSEFLRTDAEIFSQPASPIQSRHGSMVLQQTPARQRLRRNSSNFAATSFSRYANEWTELGRLGKGGFGEVVKARNKMDGGVYALKKIKQKTASALTDVLSEVMLLSRLNHPYVVRYFTAWLEEEIDEYDDAEDTMTTATETATDTSAFNFGKLTASEELDFGRSTTGGLDFISSGYPKIQFGGDSDDDSGAVSDNVSSDSEYDMSSGAAVTSGDNQKKLNGPANEKALALRRTSSSKYQKPVKSTLYIQMEYCERHTLRDLIRKGMEDDEMWKLFRQVVEGLAHIHGHGIIHRDLKPDNVFIDFAGNPKVGDFGLATSGQYQLVDKSTSNGRTANGDMTRSIGTTYYVAPELRSSGSGSYNDKVDMYSLGIIFFEMNVPLHTAMERDQAIRSVREKERTLPAILETPAKALQAAIITALINHKPSERPTSLELLQSGKIPVMVEDETIRRALEGLSDHSSPYHRQMMTTLFSQTKGRQVQDYTWDLGASNSISDANESLLLTRNLVKERLIAIFQHHGAVETQRQQLLPRSPYYANNNVVQLLDPSGTLVQLPYDLILPHARSIARKQPAADRSFAFGTVFRENVVGGAPQTSGEVDFDIISRDRSDLAIKDAEVIKVLDEIIHEFPGVASAPMCFHLNHADLLDVIMDFCRISIPQRQAVKEQISKLNILDNTWAKVRNELRSPALAVASTSLDDMARFDFRDTPDKAMSRINAILEGTPYRERIKSCLNHLEQLVQHLKDLGVRNKIFLCPLSAINEKFYCGGLMFQCLFDRKKRAVLAAGGRYDKLIEDHKPKGQGVFTGCHAVGFNLSWDRLVIATDKLLHSKTKSNAFLKRPKDDNGDHSAWKTHRCDVLVAAYDDAVLRTSGLRILADLWANNISAELAGNGRTLDEIMTKHRTETHSWIVIIKPDSVAAGRPDLKVRSLATREDSDVKADNLIAHLQSELRERDHAEGKSRQHQYRLRGHMGSSENTPNTPATYARQSVQVLTAQHRSKKSNKWNILEAVQSRAQALLSEYSNAPIAAVETRDEVLEMIRAARLSDPESWRKVVHAVPLTERDYVLQIQELLDGFRREWLQSTEASYGEAKSRVAFVSNFRTGHVLLYDLGL